MSDSVNVYGDTRTLLAQGHGIDIASQRADDLDQMALGLISTLAATRVPIAIDAASGAGGQALRMAKAGAYSIAIDIADLSSEFERAKSAAQAESSAPIMAQFFQLDLRSLPDLPGASMREQADLVVCQRAIHYLPLSEAILAVRALAACLASGGDLFLSASGIASELGNGYPHREKPLPDRFAPLEESMRQKHGIFEPVCLYSEQEIRMLLLEAGLIPQKIFSSAFGNIKAVARKP